MPQTPRPLLILGASTRAAAQSAVRAGFRPYCADVFADEDLREIAVVHQVSVAQYPEKLLEIADRAPPAPWMYTGAMENYPDFVERLAKMRPLWGNPGDAIRKSRDPFLMYEALRAAGLPALRVRAGSDPPDPDGTWMLKPERSGGGRGIHVWNHSAAGSHTLEERHWFQERAEGLSLAAIFVASSRQTTLVGLSRQLVGSEDGSCPMHGYTGSIAPYELQGEARSNVERMGRVLTEMAGLRGIFGVDFLLNEEGAWPVDLNPRYTASVEVLEHAYDLQLIAAHAEVFEGVTGSPPTAIPCDSGSPRRYVGKTILFTPHDIVVPDLANLFGQSQARTPLEDEYAILADRPAVGSRIAAGKPICSIIVAARTETDCRERLGAHVRRVRQVTVGDDRPVTFA